MKERKIEWKIVGIAILLSLLMAVLIVFQDTIYTNVKLGLEWKFLNATLWGFFLVSFLVHYIGTKDITSDTGGLIFKHFGKFADTAFAIVTYGVTSTTSAAILKGVYIQQFSGGEIYFKHFDEIDVYSMLIVSGFLLFYSIRAGITALYNGITTSQANMALAVSEDQ